MCIRDRRKSEIGVCRTVLTMFRRQTEVAVEGILRVEVDTPALEIRIELLLCLPVLRVELVQGVDVYKRQPYFNIVSQAPIFLFFFRV